MATIAAARLGKSSVILERTNHPGGLPANGLGAADIETREATTGLFREFVNRVKQSLLAE
jgi:NADPH-dependent 2,4-dienoyl-CoA reductase/sulfur reductase-like enzyme